ncbi:MAG: FecR domain-containing protein, partial [Anaerolineae bacterium]|nr:FecR domain-containing protein [Anaerolineae bacterium]
MSTPEGKAWGILLTAFMIFCILAITIPLAVRWHLINATLTPKITLKPIEAAVRIRESENNEFLAVTQDRDDLVEGTVIATDEYSRGFVRLFENSTLTLYNDTELVLRRARMPRYRSSPRPNEIRIQIRKGRVAIGAAAPAPPDERALQLIVQTPHASVTLEEGSYSVLVDPAETQVTVLLGKATIDTGDETQTWRNGRCRVADG